MRGPISVIVTTYDRPDALDAVLRSLSHQTDRNFEVVIADDGSAPPTGAVINSWTGRIGVPLRHVWREHREFRAAEMRNRAILRSSGRYCIFLDGDCLARPGFVAAHRRLAERGWFVVGNRLFLSEELTERALREGCALESWSNFDFLRARLAGDINRLLPILALPLGPLRKVEVVAWPRALSCNLAIWRENLDSVDGFDAAFTGWGHEDADLVLRLLRMGVRRKSGRFATGVLHLSHPIADRSGLSANEMRLSELMNGGRVRALQGLSILRNDSAAEHRASAK